MSVHHATLRLLILWICLVLEALAVDRPNIVIVLADDLGWNDVSFHGSNQIQTPNIDALAYNGIILNSHYVPALCTPSRASLLTGKYPTSMGMQHLVILAPEPWGLPLEETLMSQHLKRHGYATHAIGKWHLGFHEKEYTPIYRGFDSHFGYWNGFQDYYDHTMQSESLKGYDMRRGLSVDHDSKGVYSTDAFTNEAVNIIENHNSTQGPLFLYLAHLAPHAGNPDEPFQAPEEEVAKHAHIADPERRIYAAMVTKVDESVGRVMTALRERNMLDNSIILFMSDNGAVTFGMHSNRGSNYPLRGLKESPWEGGVRGVAAVWSPLLNRTRRVSDQLMHMADWLPTLYSAAGLDASELGPIDGMDMWPTLSHGLESPRTEVFNNYDEVEDYSSLRMDSWKYVADRPPIFLTGFLIFYVTGESSPALLFHFLTQVPLGKEDTSKDLREVKEEVSVNHTSMKSSISSSKVAGEEEITVNLDDEGTRLRHWSRENPKRGIRVSYRVLIVSGTAQAGEVDLWYGESGEDGRLEYEISKVLDSSTHQAIAAHFESSEGEKFQSSISQETILNLRRDSVISCDYATFASFSLITDNHNETVDQSEDSRSLNGLSLLSWKDEIISELESYLTYPLGGVLPGPLDRSRLETLIESGELRKAFKCDPLKMVCLFNLEKDPCERVNLAKIFPSVVQTLEERLIELKKSVVKPLNQPDDPFSNPAFHNGTWANWRDVRREMESASAALYLDQLFTVLPENVFALFPDAFQESYFHLLHLLQRFFWLVTLLVCAVTVLYAIASLRKVVDEPQGDPARKKSWTNWENLTFRSITNPSSQSDVGRTR